MDGLDDEPASHKTKKPMKIKLKSFPVIDESFVNMAPQAEKPAKLEKSKKPTKSQATVKSEKKPEKGEILKMSSKAPEARSLIAGSKAINSNSPTSSRDSRDLTKRRVSFHSPISSVQTLQKSSPQLKKLKVMVKKAVVEKTPTKEQPIKSEPRNKSKQIATEPEKISSKPFKESVVKSRFFLEAEPSPRRLRNRSTSDQKDEEPSTSKNVARPSSRNLKRPIISATEKNSKKPKLLVTPAKPTGTKKKARPVDSDSDEFLGFDPSSAKKVRPSTSISPVKKTPLISRNRDKRVLSTDVEDVEDSPSKAKNGIDIWCEVYAEKEKKWFCLDIFKGKIDCATAVYVS